MNKLFEDEECSTRALTTPKGVDKSSYIEKAELCTWNTIKSRVNVSVLKQVQD